MYNATENTCKRCGHRAPGRYRWMFHLDWAPELLIGSPVRREFLCFRCLGIMRIYSIIGMTIFAILIVVIIAATIWVWNLP